MPKHVLIFSLASALLVLTGCAIDREARRTRALRRESAWPEIQSVAEQAVARQRKDAEFAHCAFYAPGWHRNGIWFVVVSSVQRQGAYYRFAPGGLYGGYPRNMWQNVVDISVTDSGDVATYSTHAELVPSP
jgi:hypothetical protein